MGGVIGAMSTKFVVHAGMLLLSARVDGHSLQAALDPSSPRTIISVELAKRIGLPPKEIESVQISHGWVIGIDHYELRLGTVRVAAHPGAAPVIIGADILAHAPLLLDFERHRLSLIERSNRGLLQGDQLSRITDGMTPLQLKVSSEGCFSVTGQDLNWRPISVGWKGTSGTSYVEAPRVQVHFGMISLPVEGPSKLDARCGFGAIIGWESFNHRRIVFDLPHHTLWLGLS